MSKNLLGIADSVAVLKVNQIGENTQTLINAAGNYAKLLLDHELQDIMDWLSPINFSAKQNDIFSKRHEGTAQWLLEHDVFKAWVNGTQKVLWCPGIRIISCPKFQGFTDFVTAGSGKTVLA
jgi:hypothetical protein